MISLLCYSVDLECNLFYMKQFITHVNLQQATCKEVMFFNHSTNSIRPNPMTHSTVSFTFYHNPPQLG